MSLFEPGWYSLPTPNVGTFHLCVFADDVYIRPYASNLFRRTFGEYVKTKSATRWWSWFEVAKQLSNILDRLPPFLEVVLDNGFCEKTTELINILSDDNTRTILYVELFSLLDAAGTYRCFHLQARIRWILSTAR